MEDLKEEKVLIIADILKASALGKVEEVKIHFKKLAEVEGYIVKGKESDYNSISIKAAELLSIITVEDDSEPALNTLGSLIGLNVVKQETEEGNEIIES